MSKRNDGDSTQTVPHGSGQSPAARPPQPGEAIFTLARDGRVRSRDEIVRDLQDYFCALAPAARVLSEELIADRRREFEMEEAETNATPPGPRP